jgi:hypothetical protein
MQIRTGERLRSAVDTTEVMIIRSGPGDVALTCGGHAMVPMDAPAPLGSPAPGHDVGTALGKRYANADATIEILCTKSGSGSLQLDGQPLSLKQAKGLPASD